MAVGRPRFGEEPETGYIKFNITIPPSLVERLEKYMKDEERNRSWTIQKALDEYLKKKGY